MAKVKELSRNEDYVRFCFDVTVEESGVEIDAVICGTVDCSTRSGALRNLHFVCIDDVDWNEMRFMGKPVKQQAFKEMYNKLFKEDYNAFDRRIDAAAEKAVLNEFDNCVHNLTPAQAARYLDAYLKEAKIKVQYGFHKHASGCCNRVVRGYFVGQLARQMNLEPQTYDSISDNKDGTDSVNTRCSAWNLTLLESMINKYTDN